MKVVVDRAIPFLQGVLEPFAEVEYIDGNRFTPEVVRDADALIIRTRTRCNRELLEGSNVQFIATATIGFDHIDLDYCQAHNITVSTSAGCNARGVLQWVSAALAMLAQRENFHPHERTLGIVGVGNVGKLVKEYAEAWGFRTICSDPPREEREHLGFVSLEEVLRSADIVTLHTPLNSLTHHLINDDNNTLLRSGATLINASRGECVATSATRRNDLTYITDVWENEPNIDCEYLAKSLIATPHIAGYSAQGKANASAMAVQALARHFSLPLTAWQPAEVEVVTPKMISWEEMCATIEQHCNLAAESNALRSNPEQFEHLRNNYHYREEYF
ncbi:MAG: 4-phosphoerythronate dehydrogenase [Alistipes sp.]|nr:4-phosphoerythronate dehydrogenase [Alistipes sp.]